MNACGAIGERIRKSLAKKLPGREAWALGDQAVVSGTNFLTNVMLARFLGLHEFGVFALAWMAVLFVNSLQSALIVAPMMSIGPKQEEKDQAPYFGAVFVQELVFVSLCFILVFTVLRFCTFRDWHIQHLAGPLAVSAFAYQLQDFIRRYFFATRQSGRAFAEDALSYLPQLPIVLVLHQSGNLNIRTALWAMAGTSLFGILVGWFWLGPIRLDRQWVRTIVWRHWKTSRWLGASALLQWTSGNLFVIAAPFYYGAAASGILRASQNLMGVAHVWFQGLDNVVPAETARRFRDGGMRTMLSYTKSILVKWGGLTLLFALMIGLAPGFWLRLVYGSGLGQYGYVLRLYALLYVIIFIGGPLRAALQALEFTVPIFWSYLATTSFAFIFAVPMAKWLGLSGTMLGLLGTQMIFQSIIATALLVKANRIARGTGSALRARAVAD
jgi:O-antigen/teichoic acid export membrane protein